MPYIIQGAKIRRLFGFKAMEKKKIYFFVKKRGKEGEKWDVFEMFKRKKRKKWVKTKNI